jgi:fucose permease
VFTYGGLLGLVIQTSLVGPAVKWVGENRLAALGFLGMTFGFTLVGASSKLWIFIAGYTLIQCGASFLRATLNGLISRTAPRHMQGTIFGVTQTLLALAAIGAPLVSGALIETEHYSSWAWVSAFVALAGLFLIRMHRANPITR